MSSNYKTVIHISSIVEKPRRAEGGERRGSDPRYRDAGARGGILPATTSRLKTKEGSPSSSKHSTPTEHIEIGQPCLKCGPKCPGYMQHVWRKQCLHCGCGRSSHSIETEPSYIIPLLEELTLSEKSQKLTGADVERLRKYAWYPPGLSYGMVQKYMDSLPTECVPVVGTEGAKYRRAQCFIQLPLHDFSLDACHKISEVEKKRHRKLASLREQGFGVGSIQLKTTNTEMGCTECMEGVTMENVYVVSDRAGEDKQWHPQCFRCNTCHELLVDLIHYHSTDHEGLYCGRHYLELLIPRCAGCDEVILAKNYTEAGSKNWHKEHYCCIECDDNLDGKLSTTHEGKLVCNRCYSKYASKCHRCKDPVRIDQKKVSVKGRHYHRNCFVCKRCWEDLAGERYFVIDNDIVCPDCMKPIGQCQGCKEGISPSVSYLKSGDKCWHADCFRCNVCRTWLVDGQYHEMASSIMCNSCYVEKMSPKCEVCSESIAEKGIQFALKSYHMKCFACVSCQRSLVSENGVKEYNGEPYCQNCVANTYKKCFKCRGAIKTRHTIYKGHPFHLQCFQCNKCGRSIAGADFFESSLGEVMCSRCAD